jgi:hypothetical protein
MGEPGRGVSVSNGRIRVVTESNVSWLVRGIRDGTIRIDPALTAVRAHTGAEWRPGARDVASPAALADFIETMFFDPSVEVLQIVLLD